MTGSSCGRACGAKVFRRRGRSKTRKGSRRRRCCWMRSSRGWKAREWCGAGSAISRLSRAGQGSRVWLVGADQRRSRRGTGSLGQTTTSRTTTTTTTIRTGRRCEKGGGELSDDESPWAKRGLLHNNETGLGGDCSRVGGREQKALGPLSR